MLTQAVLWSFASAATIPATIQSNSRIPAYCPDYSKYSSAAHGPYSTGQFHLPYMRPSPGCRTFNSSAVESTISQFVPRFKDPDVGRLFENAYPNTLDTTVRYVGESLAFIVTGDIDAEWFRDSYNQLKAYANLIPQDKNLAELFRKTIALQARYFTQYPFCNSFQPPAESGIPPETVTDSDCDYTSPSCKNSTVYTCNYELDSFGAFQALSALYYQKTGDVSFVTTGDGSWTQAIESQLQIMEAEQVSTLDGRGYIDSALNFTRPGNEVINNGVGPPQKSTGMIGTSFRPSDDKVVFRYHIPDNALLAVTLQNIAPLLSNSSSALASRARQLSQQIRTGIEQFGVVNHPHWGQVYAYEVDGYGSHLLMDDANVPSLLSLPYLGYCNTTQQTYQNTRAMILSSQGNPYYNGGRDGAAIGSPHTGIEHVWPMSLVTQIFTSNDDDEISLALRTLVRTTSGLGLIHESFYTHNSSMFTRQWFAWANSYFGECMVDLAKRKPNLLF